METRRGVVVRGMHRYRSMLVSGLLAANLCVPALGQATKPASNTSTKTVAASAQKLPTIQYEKYKLKNGLEVILSEDHRLPLVAVDLWYHVGPANEKPGRTGFA